MRAHCPKCGTVYEIDRNVLRAAQGLARCFNCGQVFDALANTHTRGKQDLTTATAGATPVPVDGSSIQQGSALPFEIPADLPELMPSDKIALDAHDTLHPSNRLPSPWWQKLTFVVLLAILLLQLAWLYRDLWIYLPQTTQLCAVLDCQSLHKPDPERFQVVERDMLAVPGTSTALRLHLSFRNTAAYAQALPRLQLSLLDDNGTPVARRLFKPSEYLPISWSGPPVALPDEVVTIELVFEDPGPRVRGFVFDFL